MNLLSNLKKIVALIIFVGNINTIKIFIDDLNIRLKISKVIHQFPIGRIMCS